MIERKSKMKTCQIKCDESVSVQLKAIIKVRARNQNARKKRFRVSVDTIFVTFDTSKGL